MTVLPQSGEYNKEKQKILHSYFVDIIDILSESYSPAEIEYLFESLSFRIADIKNKSRNLTFNDYLNLLAQIQQKCQLPGLGLKLGIVKSVKNFGIYGYALMSSTTFEQFTSVSEQIFDAIYNLLDISHKIVGDMLEISYLPKKLISHDIYIILMEQAIACGISLMHTQLPEGVNWSDCVINCDYQAPAHARHYHRYFPGEINFNMPVTQLCVPARWMQLSLRTGNNYIYSLCANKIDDILSNLNTQNTLSNRVRHILLTSNFNHLPTINQVAGNFHMAERTLRLRLAQENTSYRAILNEVRNELAHRYLNESSLSIQQIAFSLGYEHAQNFYRAFLKANAVTPEQFRRQNQLMSELPSS